MPVSPGHTASAQRTVCGLSSYKDVAGELRGKPRIQKLLLLKVNLFFFFFKEKKNVLIKHIGALLRCGINGER